MSVGPRRRANPIEEWGVKLGVLAGRSSGGGVGAEQRRITATSPHASAHTPGTFTGGDERDAPPFSPRVDLPLGGRLLVAGRVTIRWPWSAPEGRYMVYASWGQVWPGGSSTLRIATVIQPTYGLAVDIPFTAVVTAQILTESFIVGGYTAIDSVGAPDSLSISIDAVEI